MATRRLLCSFARTAPAFRAGAGEAALGAAAVAGSTFEATLPAAVRCTDPSGNRWAISGPATPGLRWRSTSSSSDSDFNSYDLRYDTRVSYPRPQAKVGEAAPHFEGPAVVDGEISDISLDDYLGRKYVVLFFYPKDFTFVCPTEIIAFSDRAAEFEALGVQLIAASTDTEESHLAWINMPRRAGGLGAMDIPILADTTKTITARYGCLLEHAGIALRGLYIIDREGVLQHSTVNSLSVGRSVDEVLRLVSAIQFVEEHGEVCPANWAPGAATIDTGKASEYFESLKEAGEGDQAPFGETLTSIESPKAFADLINSGRPVVVDFMAPWCGKCRKIAPAVEELQAAHPGVEFAKFNTEDPALQDLGRELGVPAMPAFRFYHKGEEVVEAVIGYKKKLLTSAVETLSGHA